jgi:hypothetical protein
MTAAGDHPAHRLREFEPVAFQGTDIWSTGNPPSTGAGWLGRH